MVPQNELSKAASVATPSVLEPPGLQEPEVDRTVASGGVQNQDEIDVGRGGNACGAPCTPQIIG